MSFHRTLKAVMLAALVIPTHDINDWKLEHFSRIPSNNVSFSDKGILIHIKSSASPLIYPLKSTLKLTSFKVRGNFLGLPHFSDISRQGESGADDYPLRIGFIVPGDKRLTGFRKFFASEWVRNLYSQLPNDLGLDHIHFFNITQNPLQVGKSRIHPASNLMREEFIDVVKEPGSFEFKHTLKEPLEVAALWISIDGDDTKSEYEVLISDLLLTTIN